MFSFLFFYSEQGTIAIVRSIFSHLPFIILTSFQSCTGPAGGWFSNSSCSTAGCQQPIFISFIALASLHFCSILNYLLFLSELAVWCWCLATTSSMVRAALMDTIVVHLFLIQSRLLWGSLFVDVSWCIVVEDCPRTRLHEFKIHNTLHVHRRKQGARVKWSKTRLYIVHGLRLCVQHSLQLCIKSPLYRVTVVSHNLWHKRRRRDTSTE